jgi:hypothetical protein
MKKLLKISLMIIILFSVSKLVSASGIIIYSDNDYGCGWENYASAVTIENSYEIGVNVALYVADGSNSVNIMRVIHNGDWNADPGSDNNLVSQIILRTGIAASFGGNARLGVADLSNVDLLYITGHYRFSLTDSEKNALKDYLDNGGVLLADDCSNYLDNQGFETSFRNLVFELYGSPLAVLPSDHAVYSSFYSLDGSNFSYSYPGNGTQWNTEPLEGYAVIIIVPAAIDFDPNTLNLQSKGRFVTVYIQLPEEYDVNDIDISTILLNEQIPAESEPTEIGYNSEADTYFLMVKFNRSAVQDILEVGEDVEIMVTGDLSDGKIFEGRDIIRVIDNQ